MNYVSKGERIFSSKIAAAGLAAAMAIGGCAAQPKPAVDMPLVQQIQAAIVGTCGYKVQLESLIAVLNTFVPGAGLASIAIETICRVVEPLTVAHAGPAVRYPPPEVNGVRLKGNFVGKPGSSVPLPRPRPK